MTERSRRPTLREMDEEASVSPLELFFDLVFVFGMTQVTAFMADHLSAEGLLRGVLIVTLLWWSWTGYAWLDNVVRADEGLMRAVQFLAMGAMFLIALSIPEAFDDMPGGVSGPVVVALCYFAFRVLHLALFFLVSREDERLRRQLVRWTPSVAGGTAVLLTASQFQGPLQTALWALALVVDYLGTAFAGASDWRLASPAHFAERHGLIIIVALGESIVAIGVGVVDLPVSGPIFVASVLGLGIAAALWWLYFDVTALMAERALSAASREERSAMGRDAYSFIHLPMVAGIVLGALGLKKVLEYVGDTEHHELADALPPPAIAALYGGALLYLLGHVAFKYRTTRLVSVPRLAASAAVAVLGVAAAALPALAALGVLTAVLLALVVFETTRWAQVRAEVRAGSGHPAAETR